MIRSAAAPAFDHGAALRVPATADAHGWGALMVWLGEAGHRLAGARVEVSTPAGPRVAGPGDWVVLSVAGVYHVAICGDLAFDA